MNATATGNVVSCVGRLAGRKLAAEAMAALLRAVDQADIAGGRVVLAGDMFSCFVAVPAKTGDRVQLRAWWLVDVYTQRRTVIRVQKGLTP